MEPVEAQADLLEVSRFLCTYLVRCPSCEKEHFPRGNTPRSEDQIPPLAVIACECGTKIKPVNDRFIAERPHFSLAE